jgi:large subunit ribosomal protein L18
MHGKLSNPKARKHAARRARVVNRLEGSSRVRLTVFRSAKHIYAQLIDVDGRTLATVSTRSSAVSQGLASTGNVEAARKVGKAVAEVARQKQIEKVVFNRNGFLYHGRVKALADAAREAGLQF